jgi:hypothetical protein
MNNKYINVETLIIWLENLCVSKYIIEALKNNKKWPPADVEEKQYGIWTHAYSLKYQCSNCKQLTEQRNIDILYHRCPHCGAHMTNY